MGNDARLTSPPRIDTLDDEDESVRIAICALGDMKKGARTASSATTNHPCTSTSISPVANEAQDIMSPDFVSRVSNIPLVNTALRAYEQGKASSRVVKYGAEMMESSVKSISRPVFGRLPVEQLDEFACRQLDKLEKYRRPSSANADRMQIDEQPRQYVNDQQPPTLSSGSSQQPHAHEDGEPGHSLEADSHTIGSHPTNESRGSTPLSPMQDQHGQAVTQRSRWQVVLLEAGGIGAAVSEESMRRLKYCLHWLQYATSHIDAQIVILRDFIASLQPDGNAGSPEGDSYVSPTHMRTLTDVRRDVVQTIRQVVDVVSKYAGGTLPEPARARVRAFILHLPQRWASANASTSHVQGISNKISNGPPGANSVIGASASGAIRRGRGKRHWKERSVGGGPGRSLSGTPASSRASSPITAQRATGMARAPTASAVARAAQHILTLATESLDMMRGVTGVVKESLDRAEIWVERLRIIGVQRQSSTQDGGEPLEFPFPDSSAVSSTPTSTSYTSLSFTDHRNTLPGLSSTPSTPALTSTPFSVPTTPAAYASPEGLNRGDQLMETASLSELCLDGEGEGYGTRGDERRRDDAGGQTTIEQG